MTTGPLRPNWRAAAAVLLTLGALALSLPPLRPLIEQSMVWHMLVQMPLLVLSFGLLAMGLLMFLNQ